MGAITSHFQIKALGQHALIFPPDDPGGSIKWL